MLIRNRNSFFHLFQQKDKLDLQSACPGFFICLHKYSLVRLPDTSSQAERPNFLNPNLARHMLANFSSSATAI